MRDDLRAMRRSFPLVLAVLAASLLIAAVAPPSGAGAAGNKSGGSALPLTFGEAQAQGKKVDWGPNCDTTTGKVAVPTGYAPPCVEPWPANGKTADNGGKTAPGVTADTITIALYQAQPDLLQQSFFEASGSDESLAAEKETTQQYIDFFSAHYELYGRKIQLVTLKASGPPDDDVAAKAGRDQGGHRAPRVRVVRRPRPDARLRRGARGSRGAVPAIRQGLRPLQLQ